ncbi:hypothetical protein DFJ77DRAFT_345233 [Powellomyces hirtus]|nr:hypothetical protein DFJ77DRAFT_345233 [Powellomyces hirtus]
MIRAASDPPLDSQAAPQDSASLHSPKGPRTAVVAQLQGKTEALSLHSVLPIEPETAQNLDTFKTQPFGDLAASAERGHVCSNGESSREPQDPSQGGLLLTSEESEILCQMKKEQAIQLQEVQTTRLALLELQKQRVQLEYARSTIVAALESGDLDALEKIKAMDSMGDEEVDEVEINDLMQNAKDLGVAREALSNAMDQQHAVTPGVSSGHSFAHRNREPENDESPRSKTDAILSPGTKNGGNQCLQELMMRFHQQYNEEEPHWDEMERQELFQSWDQLQGLKEQVMEAAAAVVDDMGEPDVASSVNTGPFSPEQFARHGDTCLTIGPDEESSHVRPYVDMQHQQVAALRQELRMLQAYKATLDAHQNDFTARNARRPHADASSDSLTTLVRNSPEKMSTAVRPQLQHDDLAELSPSNLRRHARVLIAKSGDGSTDALIERLMDASVRERMQKSSREGPQPVLPGNSPEGGPENRSEGNFQAITQKTGHVPGIRKDVTHGTRSNERTADPVFKATPSIDRRVLDVRADIDAERVEQGMHDILENMRTIQKARHVATGAQRVQFDALFERLQSQLSELQQVQTNVSYFRDLVRQQVEKPPLTNRIDMEARNAGKSKSSFNSASGDSMQPNIGSVQTRTRQPFKKRISDSTRSPGQQNMAGLPTRQTLGIPLMRNTTPVLVEDDEEDDRTPLAPSRSWTEHAEVNEYDLIDGDDVNVQTSLYESSQQRKENICSKGTADPLTKRLFEECKDTIYRSAAGLISQNESEPYFLLQFFKKAAMLDSSYARQRLMLEMDKILDDCAAGSQAARLQSQSRPPLLSQSQSSLDQRRDQTSFADLECPSPMHSRARRGSSNSAELPHRGQHSETLTPPERAPHEQKNTYRLPVPATQQVEESQQPDLQQAHNVASDVQDRLIEYMAHIPEAFFTSKHVADMQSIVLRSVAWHLESTKQLGVGPVRELLTPVLDGVLNKYVAQHAVELGSVLVEEVGRVVSDIIYVTEEELARSAQRMQRESNDASTSTAAIENDRAQFFRKVHPPTPPRGRQPAPPTYHLAADCQGSACRWDHEALDELVQRLSTKHEWGAIMDAIARVEGNIDPSAYDGLDHSEEEDSQTESDESESDNDEDAEQEDEENEEDEYESDDTYRRASPPSSYHSQISNVTGARMRGERKAVQLPLQNRPLSTMRMQLVIRSVAHGALQAIQIWDPPRELSRLTQTAAKCEAQSMALLLWLSKAQSSHPPPVRSPLLQKMVQTLSSRTKRLQKLSPPPPRTCKMLVYIRVRVYN